MSAAQGWRLRGMHAEEDTAPAHRTLTIQGATGEGADRGAEGPQAIPAPRVCQAVAALCEHQRVRE